MVIGRHSTQVRICSCPGRDIRGEEDKISDEPAPEQSGTNNLIPIQFPPVGTKGKTKKRKTTSATSSATSATSLPSGFTTHIDGDVYKVNLEVVPRFLIFIYFSKTIELTKAF